MYYEKLHEINAHCSFFGSVDSQYGQTEQEEKQKRKAKRTHLDRNRNGKPFGIFNATSEWKNGKDMNDIKSSK